MHLWRRGDSKGRAAVPGPRPSSHKHLSKSTACAHVLRWSQEPREATPGDSAHTPCRARQLQDSGLSCGPHTPSSLLSPPSSLCLLHCRSCPPSSTAPAPRPRCPLEHHTRCPICSALITGEGGKQQQQHSSGPSALSRLHSLNEHQSSSSPGPLSTHSRIAHGLLLAVLVIHRCRM